MAVIKFYLSAKADATGEHEVLIRFFHGSINQRGKSGVFIAPESWNPKTQQVIKPNFRKRESLDPTRFKHDDELEARASKLQKLAAHISKTFNSAMQEKKTIGKGWLKDCISAFYSPTEASGPVSIWECLDEYLASHPQGESRRRHLLVVRRDFKRFELFTGTEHSLDTITKETLEHFYSFLSVEHEYLDEKNGDHARYMEVLGEVPESRQPKERGCNSIGSIMRALRSFIKWAVLQGYTDNDPFTRYSIPAELYGTPYYITDEERKQIFAADLSKKPALEAQRDIFVFQCLIGCRVSDLRRLTKQSVINGAIEYIPRKTSAERPAVIRVPLNQTARAILAKYEGLDGERLLPFISDQKYNDAIKAVFTAAGVTRMVTILNTVTRQEEKRPINEVASSHMARRAFIGNLYKKVKDPSLVCQLSGHVEGSRAFARYRTIDEDMKIELVSLLD